MMNRLRTLIRLLCSLLLTSTAFAQTNFGNSFIQYYSVKEYEASTQNWAIIQDDRGELFFGNTKGILEYNGSAWNVTPAINHSIARSFAKDKNGIIYVGFVGDFGYLKPTQNGELKIVSLLDKLPIEDRDFADVWKTYVVNDEVYFQTNNAIFVYSKEKIRIIKPSFSEFHFSYTINENYYILEKGVGLCTVVNDKIVVIPNGEFFKDDKIYSILPYDKNFLLIACRENGLFLFNPTLPRGTKNAVLPFKTNIDEFLYSNKISYGIRINNSFAYATLSGGVAIIDTLGTLIQLLNKKSGLKNENVKCLALDKQQALWIGLDNGIARAEVNIPIRYANETIGLNGTVESMATFNNKIYAATSQGVFSALLEKKVDDFFKEHDFTLVEGLSSQSKSLLSVNIGGNSKLLAGTKEGIFDLTNETPYFICEGFGFKLFQSIIHPSRIYIGYLDGLGSIRFEKNKWIDEGRVPGLNANIIGIAEDPNGNIWLGTPYSGVYKVLFNGMTKNVSSNNVWEISYKISEYDTTNGLPSLLYVTPFNDKDQIIFETKKGIYAYDDTKNKFSPFSKFGKIFSDGSRQVYTFNEDEKGNAWISSVEKFPEFGECVKQASGEFEWYTIPFKRTKQNEIRCILPDKGDFLWYAGTDGIECYNQKIKYNYLEPFNSLINRVQIGHDSLIFNGSFYTYIINENDSLIVPALLQHVEQVPIISYQYNAITFSFSCTSFDIEKENQYRYYLEGFDSDWGLWRRENKAIYTNLSEGKYTFHLISKNIYDIEGAEVIYQFVIEAPWYRSFWAYLVYLLVFIGFIYGIIKISVHRLEQAKIKLEGIVKERTAEVVKQKEEVERQKEEVEKQKGVVEEHQKEILDSITYARRIQYALLASDSLLNNNLPAHFVLFKPKDVVSGDFYWAAPTPNGFVYITADCTGHGVPGAFMSLLNISKLSQTINENKITRPDLILNNVRNEIISALNPPDSKEESKDGMDAILCSLDVNKLTLQYAAANNSFYIIRNNEIIHCKADKMPVGKYHDDTKLFSFQEISLMKGDTIYTFTDGYADQFGGPLGKKYKYKQLEELLLAIVNEPMEIQKQKLLDSFLNWKGELEQVDDVCVIGVRIL